MCARVLTPHSSFRGLTRRHALRHQVLRLNQVGTRPHEENAANAVRIRDIVLAVEAIRAGVHVYLASLPAGKRLEDGGRRQRRDGHRCTGLHLPCSANACWWSLKPTVEALKKWVAGLLKPRSEYLNCTSQKTLLLFTTHPRTPRARTTRAHAASWWHVAEKRDRKQVRTYPSPPARPLPAALIQGRRAFV